MTLGERDWSAMAVRIRPDVHARFQQILARVPVTQAVMSPAVPRRDIKTRFKGKLSPARVEHLRKLRAEGFSLAELARRFHVATSTAARAVNGTTWSQTIGGMK